MYKLIRNPEGIVNTIQRLSDTAFIPFDPANTDYQEYLKWVAEGNLPSPADIVEPSPTASVAPLPAETN
jgi:hypothetical protein